MKTRTRWIWAILAALLISLVIAVPRHRREKAARQAEASARKKSKTSGKVTRPATAVVARSGLPAFSRHLHASGPLTVAFIGGSITQNAERGGFVGWAAEWLKKYAPGVSVKIVNAGIAGTGSDFGAQRIDRDVLIHQPDLVFVEFAVNDADRECVADMERLTRKIRLGTPHADIVFLYTAMEWSLPLLERGKFPPSVLQHERVAAHYGIPTIALGYEAARKIRSGEWTWADFSKDSCHPTAKGYASYNCDLEAALATLIAAPAAMPAPLPPTLTPHLVVYPPPVRAEPMAAAEPLLDETGVPAQQTFTLPLFGVHWIAAPRFPEGETPSWRLDYRHIEKPEIIDACAGLDRSSWLPQRWFEEARSFTGSTSHSLAKAGDHFGSSPTEASVLTWRTPEEGVWLICAAATALDGARASEDAEAGLNVVRFRPTAAQGESLALIRAASGESGKFEWQKRIQLAAGDEIAFVFLPSHFKFGHYQGFRVSAGFFGVPHEQ